MSGTAGAITTAGSNPLFSLHPNDNPGALISSVILKEDNYPEWSTELRNSLQAKRKLGFIDGTLTKPATEPDLSMWLAANSMIIGWIRTSIDPKIRSTVTYESVAETLWESLLWFLWNLTTNLPLLRVHCLLIRNNIVDWLEGLFISLLHGLI